MQCDLCGKEQAIYTAEIEGTRLKVGANCSKYGKVISRIQVEPKKEIVREKYTPSKATETIQVIVKNYAQLIKNAREKKKLKQEDFAKQLNEKTSLIHNVESGKQEPSIRLAEKLEKALDIPLIELYETKSVKDLGLKKTDSTMTIEHMVKFKTRKKN